MIYTYAAAGIAGAVLAGLLSWNVQAWRYDAQIAEIKAQHSRALADAHQKALDDTIKLQRIKDAAIERAEQRAKQNAAAAAAARRTVDGLRGTIYNFRASLPNASTAALIARADTAAELFGACVDEYRSVAESADRHAADAVMLFEAWPTPGSKNDHQQSD